MYPRLVGSYPPLWTAQSYASGAVYPCFLFSLFSIHPAGAEESSLDFHDGRPVVSLTWVSQQPRRGVARSKADEEADQLAEVAAVYADRCEHVLGSSDRLPGGTGASGGGLGGRSSENGSHADDGFALLEVKLLIFLKLGMMIFVCSGKAYFVELTVPGIPVHPRFTRSFIRLNLRRPLDSRELSDLKPCSSG